MTKRIFKYPLGWKTNIEVTLPKGATIMHVGTDNYDMPCIWALVETDNMDLVKVNLRMFGTGQEISNLDELVHFSTFKCELGIYHVFTYANQIL